MKNTEARKTAKTALGFLLVLVLLFATFFGLDVPYGVEDVIPEDTQVETQAPIENEQTNEEVQAPETEAPVENEDANKDVPVEDTTVEDTPQASAPVENENENVDNSGESNVTEPTEDDNTVTEEGDVENA
jgi:hypothetical protein